MNGRLRQSMAWLHSWAGLLLGTLLYFMFLTGTIGYFDTEIDYWMRPELSRAEPPLDLPRAIELARRRAESAGGPLEQLIIYPPTGHDLPELEVYWRTLPDETGRSSSRTEVLDRATGLPIDARATGGGTALYQMHYYLHYLPPVWAYWLAGVATMFMLVAIVSGVIAHKRIFRDFFTFRPGKGQRSWLDAHNVLGVLALPFHLMITYSGFVFFCFMYMPLVIAGSYGAGTANRDAFFDEVFARGGSVPERAGVAAPLAPLEPMAAEAVRRWGPNEVRSIDVRNPGDANARVTFTRAHVTPTSNSDRMAFDGVAGTLLESSLAARSGPLVANDTLMSLHEGLFAGPMLRWLYFLSGLAGTAMIGTGLVLWTAKRRRASATPHFGHELVERLNVGTIAGLPAAIAAYFWANRLLPASLPERASWEMNVLFIAWAALLVYPAFRPLRRAWIEELVLAAILCALIPVLNALTTNRHLGITLPGGDWTRAGFDLVLLGFGVAFAAAAVRLARGIGQTAAAANPTRPPASSLTASPEGFA